ncbi:hypothetical protein ACN4EE_19505 [Geminocystis sp. CENA526]|uniref:hypothetical protein n=1 Tax=Geminocystis sp. CENA526 TaxID=1355871 RepID=UPI003D6FEDB5
MNEIANIDSSAYITVQGNYAVINEGTGYAIINIQNKQFLAGNISSFLDCVKTLEYIASKQDNSSQEYQDYSEDIKASQESKPLTPKFDVKSDIQRLIEKYAPETVKVDKSVNFMSQSRYKCYDKYGNILGRVRGKEGNRYWQYGDLSDKKHY